MRYIYYFHYIYSTHVTRRQVTPGGVGARSRHSDATRNAKTDTGTTPQKRSSKE